MEEEAESGRNSDESLLKFFGNLGADNAFDIWADIGVEVLSELGQSRGREEEEGKKRECNKEIEATHLSKRSINNTAWVTEEIKENGKG